jgi:hypothetical protein
VQDLASLFRAFHAVLLELACTWLDLPYAGSPPTAALAARFGKPAWFCPDATAAIRTAVAPTLNRGEIALFEDTVHRFEALEADAATLVFGHGDIHGYNLAMGEDTLGPRLAGVFDLGNAGVLDIHEDLFCLSLVSESLLDEVIGAYQRLPGPARMIDRQRAAVYYRAFLFYLMAEDGGCGLEHLRRLLRDHLSYVLQTGVCASA